MEQRPSSPATFSGRTGPAAAVLWIMAAAVGAVVLASYLVLVYQQVSYPYELERLEGGVLDHCARVLAGQAVYVAPSAGFVPYDYPPFYYYACAPLVALLGPGFMGPRLLSALCWLAIAVLMVKAWREEGLPPAATVAMLGVFAAGSRLVDASWALARIDALSAALSIAGAYLVTRKGRAATIAAAVLLAAAFFTKQNALVTMAAAAGFLLLRGRGRFVLFSGAGLGAVLAAFAGLELATGGWFGRYVIFYPVNNYFTRRMIWGFFTDDFRAMWPLAAFAAAALAVAPRGPLARERGVFFAWDWLLAAGVFQSWAVRLYSGGGSLNNDIPALAAFIFFAGSAAAALFHQGVFPMTKSTKGSGCPRGITGTLESPMAMTRSTKGSGCPHPLLFRPLFPVLIILALLLPGWGFGPWTPSPASRVAGDELMRRLRAVPGDVLIPYHSHYAPLSGHPMTFNMVALRDTQRGGEVVDAAGALDSALAAIRARRYRVIVWDSIGPRLPALEQALRENYELRETFFGPADYRFYTLSGVRSRPDQWWVPRASGP